MTRVITYGTFDLLHYGHIRLLQRAKALGDWLIVGVTSDDYDKTRGKINAQQSLMERIESVRATGFADEIIIEEYEGQKIDDIQRYNIDIFTVGSDWKGRFDYLSQYCQVIYLDRTEGISSSEIREQQSIRIGFWGYGGLLSKYRYECSYVDGLEVTGIYTRDSQENELAIQSGIPICHTTEELFAQCDALYLVSHPQEHERHISQALNAGKHILCESPVALSKQSCAALFNLAEEKRLILMDSIKTAYSTAYDRMLLLIKSGKIGKVVSVDATCTSLDCPPSQEWLQGLSWNSRYAWAPTPLLVIFQILGIDYTHLQRTSFYDPNVKDFDIFTKYDFTYPSAVASAKVAKGVKSEGELIISGTLGYIYVPAPWWKMDYFEVRYENPQNNRRYFYPLEGEGIRYEWVAFVKAIQKKRLLHSYIPHSISSEIAEVIGQK